jgi:hypothetical protein
MVKRITQAALVLLALMAPRAWAQEGTDPASREDRQKQVQADTDHLVRRLAAVLRVLEYHKLDKASERKLIEEVALTLHGLSRRQMREVISRLEAAARMTDTDKSSQQIEIAYERHREILSTLKSLLARYDAIKTLDQAARVAEKLAQAELELHLKTAELLGVHDELAKKLHNPFAAEAQLLRKFGRPFAAQVQHQADEQDELYRELRDLLKQAAELRPHLPKEHQERLDKAEALASERHIPETMNQAASKLAAKVFNRDKFQRWQEGSQLQRRAADDLRELARTLRLPGDKLAALREARDRLDKAIQKQEELREQAKAEQAKLEEEAAKAPGTRPGPQRKPEKLTFPGLTPLDKNKEQQKPAARPLPEAVRQKAAEPAREMAAKQLRLETDTQDTRALLEPHAKDAAEKLAPAEQAMRQAEDVLKNKELDKAAEQQQEASKALKAARQEVVKLLAEAEKKLDRDPLAALKKAADDVGKVLKEQKEVRARTAEADTPQQRYQLPLLSDKQSELAKRTDDLKKDPPDAARPEVREALEKAGKAMQQAAKAMEQRKGEEALAQQDRALKSLEKAQKQLAEQAAQIAKRRDDIAKLEQAGKKLDELAREQGKVADKASEMAKKPADHEGNKQLAAKQGELTPQAQEVGKEVAQAAPEAMKKIAEGAKEMEAARGKLNKNEPAEAAKEAGKAAKSLDEAREAVAKALEQKRGEEIAEQAARDKDSEPANAARQLAKAIEQAKEAAKHAKQAAQIAYASKHEGAEQRLAKMQKQVAQQAAKLGLKEAVPPADQAAEALKKADVPKALEGQEAALAKLQETAQRDPHEERPKPAQAKAGSPHEGRPKTGQPHEGQPETTKAQAGKAKAGKAKAGEHEPGEKSGQAKASSPHEGQAKAGEEHGEGDGHAPMPSEAKTPGQLAQAQKALIEATKALAKSQEATEAAMAALGQAQAQAPQAVQPQLQEAGQKLAEAGKELGQGQPAQAHQAQQQAIGKMIQALDALNTALAKMGQQPAQPGQEPTALAKADKADPEPGKEAGKGDDDKGQHPGQQPGQPHQGQAKGQKPGKSLEKNEPRGSGNRIADGRVNNTKAQGKDVPGSGSFLALPPRQREMIRQALSGRLPPEYAAMIQQYYVNIAGGRPATLPAAPPKR